MSCKDGLGGNSDILAESGVFVGDVVVVVAVTVAGATIQFASDGGAVGGGAATAEKATAGTEEAADGAMVTEDGGFRSATG